ncbi:phage tail sheath subtilisin-like domain-containing protein, partial [Arthrospira platensis SPKY1]|nr:phage tail sheath subtilisin-like domain-containing protein [Arthrospira platensis SPKY1]
VNIINNTSKYVYCLDHLPLSTEWGKPASDVASAFDVVGNYEVSLAGGASKDSLLDVLDERVSGYDLFLNAEKHDISLVITGDPGPNQVDAVALIQHVIENLCEVRKDCMAFISPLAQHVINNKGNEVVDIIAYRNSLTSSSYAAMDSGWKYQYDKYNDVYRWVPLNADSAGLCARTDTSNDPWWSPAGLNRGLVKNVIKLAFDPYKAEQNDLYVNGVNSVITQ